VNAPDRTLDQRMEALKSANRIRTRRARLKLEIKAGSKDAGLIIATVPAWVESMKVWDLLLAIPKVGRVKANKQLARVRISPSKTIGGLSDRQRQDLLAALGCRRPIRSRNLTPPKLRRDQCRQCQTQSRRLNDGLCGFCAAQVTEVAA
jgi:S13-like protein